MAIPVIIITGFLGCGKTSFLRHLLPMCGEAGLRPGLIINEVGDVDVDGELLADLHAEQARLVGGCVCCTLQSQLTATVYDVLERRACDLILIECSGLSNPIDVVSALSAPALLREIAVSHIICLMDAGRVEKLLKVAELVGAQAATSDVVILNKVDTIAPDARDALEALMDNYSGRAHRHWASYGDIGADLLRKLVTDEASLTCDCGDYHEHDGADHHHHSHSLPASFCTVALSLPEGVARTDLTAMMQSLPENVIRAKGFAHIADEGWQVLHKVWDSVDIIPLGGPAPGAGGVLICIGQHLSAENIKQLVRETVGLN